MKQIAVICLFEKNALFIRDQLYALIGSYVDIQAVSLETSGMAHINAQLILLGDATVGKVIHNSLPAQCEILTMKMTISKNGFEKLLNIPKKTRVMLVNDTVQSTYDTINMLYEIGINHLAFLPYYPGMGVPPETDLVVTPDEALLVPPGTGEVLNIGSRVVDPYMIIDILTKLDLVNNNTLKSLVLNCIKDYVPRNPQLLNLITSTLESKNHLERIIEVIDEGVIAFDEEEKILIFNDVAAQIFDIPAWKVKGTTLQEFFMHTSLSFQAPEQLRDTVIVINKTEYILSSYPLHIKGHYAGGIVRCKELAEIRRLEKKISQKYRSPYLAKHSLETIFGESPALVACRTKAKTIARSDGAILIEGESGVGKEIFAQAIHNASARKDGPFIAFNCASIPDTLVESELFGYEEGAFTGARKGGKPGLFEQACGGTIFLDELADISPQMQAKLLRVLQEKEIARVGGQGVLAIDIRVISGTNKPIEAMVAEGTFRMDLFYRLHVLSLKIPPLRDRDNDILLLMRHFLREYDPKFELTPQAATALLAHSWPGNIRELQNAAAHIACMAENHLVSPTNLPEHLCRATTLPNMRAMPKTCNPTPACELDLVLLCLYQAQQNGKKIGRKALANRLATEQVLCSEGETRAQLRKLAQCGLVTPGTGRAGTAVSALGTEHLRKLGLI